MNTVNNKRFTATDERIRNAFMSLLESKNYEHISVQDICREADISRPAFYAHYDDINDLIIHIEEDRAAEAGMFFLQKKKLTPEDFYAYLLFIRENSVFYTAYFQADENSLISQKMMRRYLEVNELPNSPEIRCRMVFFMGGIRSAVREWLKADGLAELKKKAQIMYEIYTDLYFQ